MSNYIKICSFLHAHFNETMTVAENLKTIMVKNAFIERACLGTHWTCLYEAILMCTNNLCFGRYISKIIYITQSHLEAGAVHIIE